MIHIGNEEIKICLAGYENLITEYAKQIKVDYKKAIRRYDILGMILIEQHVLSDDFWGDICGLTSEVMIRYLRNSYDKDRFDIIRDENSGFPIKVIKKGKDYKWKGRKKNV